MKTFILLLFSFLLSKDSFNQTIKFANVIGKQTYEYGIKGNRVYRFDTSGNSIWSKNFSGHIVGSTYNNQLVGSAFDGTYLYVLEIQGWDPYVLSPHTYNGAIIKMDTSGNVIFVLTNSVYPGGGYNMVDVWPSFTGGAWVFDDYSPGITHLSDALLIDSNGTSGPTVNFWYGGIAHFKKLHPMPDSTYIAVVNEEDINWYNFPALTKFNLNGSVIWRRSYSTNLTPWDRLYEVASTHDSSGNVYLICSWYSDTINDGTVGLKVNSNGLVVTSKYWPGLSSTYIDTKNFRFENNQLICTYNSSEIYFDSLFNNSCLTAQNLNISLSNFYQANGGPETYTTDTFSPVSGSSLTYTATAYLDYCAILSSDPGIYSIPAFDIEPNPANKSCTVKYLSNDFTLINVVDIYGNLILRKRFVQELILDGLNVGIYFITLENKMGRSTKKLVVTG